MRKGSGDVTKGSGDEGKWCGCMNVAWALFWGGSRSTKPCVFRVQWAAADDERYLVCAAGAAAVGLPFFSCRTVTVASSCFGCACVCA